MARPQFTMNHLKFLMKGTGVEFFQAIRLLISYAVRLKYGKHYRRMRLARQEVRGVTTTQGEKT